MSGVLAFGGVQKDTGFGENNNICIRTLGGANFGENSRLAIQFVAVICSESPVILGKQ